MTVKGHRIVLGLMLALEQLGWTVDTSIDFRKHRAGGLGTWYCHRSDIWQAKPPPYLYLRPKPALNLLGSSFTWAAGYWGKEWVADWANPPSRFRPWF